MVAEDARIHHDAGTSVLGAGIAGHVQARDADAAVGAHIVDQPLHLPGVAAQRGEVALEVVDLLDHVDRDDDVVVVEGAVAARGRAEAEAAEAIDELKSLALVVEQSGARVPRYSHNFVRGVGVPDQSAVLLGLLMLRGPQTAGELRINAERWHRFADISSVDAFLEELQDRSEEKGGPLVVKLPRAPGAREQRWAHLLCGPVDTQALAAQAGAPGTGATEGEVIALTRRVAALEAEVTALRATLTDVCQQLGLASPASGD